MGIMKALRVLFFAIPSKRFILVKVCKNYSLIVIHFLMSLFRLGDNYIGNSFKWVWFVVGRYVHFSCNIKMLKYLTSTFTQQSLVQHI